MEQVLYDSGALIAIGRSHNSAKVEDHLVRLDRGDHIIVPAPVAAQVMRDPQSSGPVNDHSSELRHRPLRGE